MMHCAGIIVFRQNKDTYDVTIVTTKSGNAGFPKGKRKKHETNIECAYRELYEETSIMKDEIELIENCTFSEKSVIYYVAKYIGPDKKLQCQDPDELGCVDWVNINYALTLKMKLSRVSILQNAYKVLDSVKRQRDNVDNEGVYDRVPPPFNSGDVKIQLTHKQQRVSKTMSWALRHGIDELKLIIDKEGYVVLDELLKNERFKNVTIDDIKFIVIHNDKQRFTLKEDNDVLYIRANQGHSLNIGKNINDSSLLTEITEPYEMLFHGTYAKYVNDIKKTGLCRMKRKHIHLSNNFDAISGARRGNDRLAFIDMKAAMIAGIKFYQSSNGVILSEGLNGVIPPEFITKITNK